MSAPPSESDTDLTIRDRRTSVQFSDHASSAIRLNTVLLNNLHKHRPDAPLNYNGCTLPTGLGKTLTGLDAGLTILKQKPGNGRIVYALPFTSIIDQVAAETESIFDTDRLNGDLLTVDHHLSETSVPLHRKTEATEETPTDTHSRAESVLGESWRSGIITTTFVQLFESLTGPGNTQSMKLPSLSNSVVILDEPQTLPHRWWALIKQIAQLLMDDYNVTVIAMTATQPKLFDDLETTPPVELIREPDRYYEDLDRVQFDLHPSAEAALNGTPDPIGYEAAGSQITESASKGASVLAICNTIDSARELSESIEEQSGPLAINSLYDELLPKDAKSVSADISVDTTVARAVERRTADQPLLVHLTTRHRPVDRQHLIETTIELTKRGLPVIFVSTQLIEAGVDVSFDRVYRDFAPLDSVVQAAGRCNRSFERDTGLVTTWVLKPPSGRNRTPSTAVYDYDGNSLTKITADALASVYEGDPLEEHAVTRTAVKSYFRLLDKRNIGKREYVEYLEKANADTLGQLSLIDDRPTVEVIVTRTEVEKEHVQDLQNAYNDNDWETFRDTLSVVKPLQVSVPLPGDNEDSREDPRLGDKRDQPLHIDTQSDPYVSYFNEIDGVVLPTGTSRAQLL